VKIHTQPLHQLSTTPIALLAAVTQGIVDIVKPSNGLCMSAFSRYTRQPRRGPQMGTSAPLLVRVRQLLVCPVFGTQCAPNIETNLKQDRTCG